MLLVQEAAATTKPKPVVGGLDTILRGLQVDKVHFDIIKRACRVVGIKVKTTAKQPDIVENLIKAHQGVLAADGYMASQGRVEYSQPFPTDTAVRARGTDTTVLLEEVVRTFNNARESVEHLILAAKDAKFNRGVLELNGDHPTLRCEAAGCQNVVQSAADLALLRTCGHTLCLPCEREGPGGRHKLCPAADCGTTFFGGDINIASNFVASDPKALVSPHVSAKIAGVVDLVRSIRDAAPSDQVIVFVQYAQIKKQMVAALRSAQISCLGGGATGELGADIELFKQGAARVILLELAGPQAAGSNLAMANHIVFVSPLVKDDNEDYEALMNQAVGRAVRHGQTKKVYSYHLQSGRTIEEQILKDRRPIGAQYLNGSFQDAQDRIMVDLREDVANRQHASDPAETQKADVLQKTDEAVVVPDAVSPAGTRRASPGERVPLRGTQPADVIILADTGKYVETDTLQWIVDEVANAVAQGKVKATKKKKQEADGASEAGDDGHSDNDVAADGGNDHDNGGPSGHGSKQGTSSPKTDRGTDGNGNGGASAGDEQGQEDGGGQTGDGGSSGGGDEGGSSGGHGGASSAAGDAAGGSDGDEPSGPGQDQGSGGGHDDPESSDGEDTDSEDSDDEPPLKRPRLQRCNSSDPEIFSDSESSDSEDPDDEPPPKRRRLQGGQSSATENRQSPPAQNTQSPPQNTQNPPSQNTQSQTAQNTRIRPAQNTRNRPNTSGNSAGRPEPSIENDIYCACEDDDMYDGEEERKPEPRGEPVAEPEEEPASDAQADPVSQPENALKRRRARDDDDDDDSTYRPGPYAPAAPERATRRSARISARPAPPAPEPQQIEAVEAAPGDAEPAQEAPETRRSRDAPCPLENEEPSGDVADASCDRCRRHAIPGCNRRKNGCQHCRGVRQAQANIKMFCTYTGLMWKAPPKFRSGEWVKEIVRGLRVALHGTTNQPMTLNCPRCITMHASCDQLIPCGQCLSDHGLEGDEKPTDDQILKCTFYCYFKVDNLDEAQNARRKIREERWKKGLDPYAAISDEALARYLVGGFDWEDGIGDAEESGPADQALDGAQQPDADQQPDASWQPDLSQLPAANRQMSREQEDELLGVGGSMSVADVGALMEEMDETRKADGLSMEDCIASNALGEADALGEEDIPMPDADTTPNHEHTGALGPSSHYYGRICRRCEELGREGCNLACPCQHCLADFPAVDNMFANQANSSSHQIAFLRCRGLWVRHPGPRPTQQDNDANGDDEAGGS